MPDMFLKSQKTVIILAAVTCLEVHVLVLSRDLLNTLTIVNAKDSLWTIVQNFRPIVEFPGEELGVVVHCTGLLEY